MYQIYIYIYIPIPFPIPNPHSSPTLHHLPLNTAGCQSALGGGGVVGGGSAVAEATKY